MSFSAAEVLEEFAEAQAPATRVAYDAACDRAAMSAERAAQRQARWLARPGNRDKARARSLAAWRRKTAAGRRARGRRAALLAPAKTALAARIAARAEER